MVIYHGSEKIIEKPVYGGGKPYNDYGMGFYCTESLEMAKEWAVDADRNGFANIYEIDAKKFKILDINGDEFCILNWLAVLLENRLFDVSAPIALEGRNYILKNFKIDYENYDILTGYRADDSYFSFAQDFLNNTISLRQLENAMRLGKLGKQVVIKSKRAFDSLQYQGFELAEARLWYPAKKGRDAKARSDYFDVVKNARKKNNLFLLEILDKEMKKDDLRI